MSDTPTIEKRNYKATELLESLDFVVGISKKTGNPYLIGSVNIKSPISSTPIRLGFEYIDPNTAELIKMALSKLSVETTEKANKEFQEGLQD